MNTKEGIMEEYFIAVFKSRTQTLKFYDKLKQKRADAFIINTPNQANLGCGLSVKFFQESLNCVKKLLILENYYSFAGLFYVLGKGHSLKLKPV